MNRLEPFGHGTPARLLLTLEGHIDELKTLEIQEEKNVKVICKQPHETEEEFERRNHFAHSRLYKVRGAIELLNEAVDCADLD